MSSSRIDNTAQFSIFFFCFVISSTMLPMKTAHTASSYKGTVIESERHKVPESNYSCQPSWLGSSGVAVLETP